MSFDDVQDSEQVVYPDVPPEGAWIAVLRRRRLLMQFGYQPPRTLGWVNAVVRYFDNGSRVERVLDAMDRDPELRARIEAVWRLGGDVGPIIKDYDWGPEGAPGGLPLP